VFALSLAKQVREMINLSETMREGLVPVACAFFGTSRAAATPRLWETGLADGAGDDAARLKRSSDRKGWNLHTHTEKGTWVIFFLNE